MNEYKHGRSRNQQKIDRDSAYDDKEEHVDSKARERFLRKPYEVDDVAAIWPRNMTSRRRWNREAYTMCCVWQGYTLHPGGTCEGA